MALSDAPEPGPSRPLVGRDAELRELADALGLALSGKGRLYLISGEPGIGKTRLADAVSRLAEGRGASAFWGRCWEAGGAPAYFPWMAVIAGLASALSTGDLMAALGDGQPAVAELSPEIRARVGEATAAVPANADEARFRLFRAVASLLRQASTGGGAVLVFEDLHAADESSLLLLTFVARELRGMRVFVVATFRDVEARLTENVGAALGRLSREGSTLSLGRLRRPDVERLLVERAPGLTAEFAARVFERTQGNPLFVEEMARLLAGFGASIDAAELPAGVRDLLRERLGRVPPEAYALLEAAAVAGDEVTPAFVGAIAGTSAGAVTRAFAAGVRSGVLRSSGADRYRFFHGLVREVLEHDLTRERGESLHARAAEALEAQRGASPGPNDAEIAHHLLSSGDAHLERATATAIAASEHALSVFAYEDAGVLLERTLRAIERAGSPKALEARALVALGKVCIRRGDGARGHEVCLRAAAIARSLRDAELLGAAAAAYGLELTPALVNPTLVALLKEALEALPPGNSALRVRLMARLAAAMQPAADLNVPIGLAREAARAAEELGDEAVILDALFLGMSTMMDIVDPRERLPQNLRIEQLASKRGDAERVLRTQARLVFDHMELGELAEADARIAAYERLARETRAERYLWRVPLFRSMRAMMHGRFAESEAFVSEAEALASGAKDPHFERCCVLHREGLLRACERHDDMVAFDVHARPMRAALYSGPHWQNGGTAFTYTRVEDLPNAKRYADLVPQDDWPLVHNPPAFMHVGEPMALVGSLPLVQRVYDLLLPASHRCISWGWTKILWEGTATRVLGLLATRLGRLDEADAHFTAAQGTLERLGALPMLHRTRYEYGRALLDRGAAHEATARAYLEQAREGAVSLGMTGLVRLAELRLGASPPASVKPAPPASPAARAPQSGIPFVLTAEGEFWTVSYDATTFRLKDSLGLQYLARLVAEPNRPIHVLDLSGASREAESVDGGDAGEHLDREARDSYRARLTELRDALDEAKARGQEARASRLEDEIDFLTAELSRAVGLGGRVRRAGAASERARSAVQRRIRNVFDRVREHSPALAALLERTVKTGTTCVFSPE